LIALIREAETGWIRRRPGVLGFLKGVLGSLGGVFGGESGSGDTGGGKSSGGKPGGQNSGSGPVGVCVAWSVTWWTVCVPMSLVAVRKYRCAVGSLGGRWIGINRHGSNSSPRRSASWNAWTWKVLVGHCVPARGTVPCTGVGAGGRFLLLGTLLLGRPGEEARSL